MSSSRLDADRVRPIHLRQYSANFSEAQRFFRRAVKSTSGFAATPHGDDLAGFCGAARSLWSTNCLIVNAISLWSG